MIGRVRKCGRRAVSQRHDILIQLVATLRRLLFATGSVKVNRSPDFIDVAAKISGNNILLNRHACSPPDECSRHDYATLNDKASASLAAGNINPLFD